MELDNRLVSGLGLTHSRIETVRDIAESVDGRLRVAKLLGKIDARYWLGIGSLLAGDPSSRVRGEVALSLGMTGHEGAVPLLEKLASDGKWEVRHKVALAALDHGSQAVLPIVEKLLADDVSNVRAAARRAYFGLAALHPEAASELQNRDLLLPEVKSERSPDIRRRQTRQSRPRRRRRRLPGLSPSFSGALPAAEGWSDSQDDEGDDGCSRSRTRKERPRERRSVRQHPSDAAEAEPPMRFVNSFFVGHDDPLEPLQFGQEYELRIWIGPDLDPRSFTDKDEKQHEFTEPQDEGAPDTFDIGVYIATDDFEVLDKQCKSICLPRDRRGKSSTVAFQVKPIIESDKVSIDVTFYYENNVLHQARIGAQVKKQEAYRKSDRSAYMPTVDLFRAPVRGRRDLTLIVKRKDDGGYRLQLRYQIGLDEFDACDCTLAITPERLDRLVEESRKEVVGIVRETLAKGESSAKALLEKRLPKLVKLDDRLYDEALTVLAKAGRELYNQLFSPSWGTDRERLKADEMSKQLRRLSRQLSGGERPARIQVWSDSFFIPWNFLYDGDPSDEQVNLDEFWGFKHIIEELPNVTVEGELETVLSVEGAVRMGMNINRNIVEDNPDVSKALTEPQLTRVKELKPKVTVVARFQEDDVLAALKAESRDCQVEYYFCHADTKENVNESFLGLTSNKGGLTLRKIHLETASSHFRGSPLFILNACESAQLGGQLYDGFVVEFLRLGACAVLGTETQIPSLFGANFGMALLETFFQDKSSIYPGEPLSIGEALLVVRKQFLNQYQNPLGLLYRVFGDADARLPSDY
jgi:hypothetical protein